MMQFYNQKWIERVDLQNNPNAIFLFGDNNERKGMGGQAGAMRGEPNAIGVATKWTPTSGTNAYFTDEDFLAACHVISKDFRKVFAARDAGKMIVIPTDGLGTGLSKLPEKAPRVNAHLEWMLEMLTTNQMPAWKQLLNGDAAA
jgi:hypothetical protein